ncbi:MAG: hypothetical protein KatS3mg035_0977 [Bacteroidia bacterium]|nr:MAG: hypothetical protein KatS3mg035_0977 [Bacteroidia bacterium]
MKFQSELQNWSTSKLRQACNELIAFKNTGMLEDGHVREFAQMIKEDTNGGAFDNLSLAQSMIQDEAIRRFVAVTEALKINA